MDKSFLYLIHFLCILLKSLNKNTFHWSGSVRFSARARVGSVAYGLTLITIDNGRVGRPLNFSLSIKCGTKN